MTFNFIFKFIVLINVSILKRISEMVHSKIKQKHVLLAYFYQGWLKLETGSFRSWALHKRYSKIWSSKPLYPHQHGFRSNHSTTHALIDITTTLHENLNHKILLCSVMIKQKKHLIEQKKKKSIWLNKKNFSHERLFQKLEHYGVRGVALQLLKKILLEIGFLEELRSIWGNKEVPQA